ncbi:hypothetical protein BDQ17DRAFT_1333438 [Cyathus striatus]|nr:hypothetical protein BDQ17DRAFT_1333438 [Cyathus striatus]
MYKYQLVVSKKSGHGIEYREDWGQDRIDTLLCGLFPEIFTWLDEHFSTPTSGQYHWILLGKHFSRHFWYEWEEIHGEDLTEAWGTTSCNWKSYCICIASLHTIPHIVQKLNTEIKSTNWPSMSFDNADSNMNSTPQRTNKKSQGGP